MYDIDKIRRIVNNLGYKYGIECRSVMTNIQQSIDVGVRFGGVNQKDKDNFEIKVRSAIPNINDIYNTM